MPIPHQDFIIRLADCIILPTSPQPLGIGIDTRDIERLLELYRGAATEQIGNMLDQIILDFEYGTIKVLDPLDTPPREIVPEALRFDRRKMYRLLWEATRGKN